MKHVLKVTLLLLFLSIPVLGANLVLQNVSNVTWRSGIGYDPTSASGYTEAVNFSVNNPNASAQHYAVLFTEGNYTTGQGDYNRRAMFIYKGTPYYLNYQLYKINSVNTSYVLKDYSAVSTYTINNLYGNTSNSDRILGKTTLNFTYYVYVPPNQLVPPGAYTDTVQFRLHNKRYNTLTSVNNTLHDSRNVVITFDVIRVLDITASVSALDFQTPVTGENLNFNILVKSNVNYTLGVRSSNSSVLKHSTIANVQTTIPYTYAFNNGVLQSLSNVNNIVLSNGNLTTLTGTTFPNKVQLGTITPLVSGSYQDQLTLELSEIP